MDCFFPAVSMNDQLCQHRIITGPGRVFSSEEIYERVWQEKAINTDTIMVHVRNIREKIELDPKNPKYLKVVWGVGYKIEKQG